ncbi:MAG: helix-turn-helix domain-containing protein [Bacteroidota bacterium]|jgi:transcriptional regulator with XRE-family HTH domain
MDAEEIAVIIRKQRDALGITQQDLAFRSGVHLRSIANLEGGKGNPSLDTLIKVAEVLKLEIIIRSK